MTSLRAFPRVRLHLALVVLTASGCAGKGALRPLPPEAGTPTSYRAPAPEVANAVPAALDALGYGALEHVPDSAATVLLASKGMGLLSNGEALRLRVESGPAGSSLVRVVGRPNYALDWSGRVDRHAVQVLGELDRVLGPDAVLPGHGSRVRGRTPDGVMFTGDVVETPEGPIVVQSADSGVRPLGELELLEVSRGGWNHGRTGAAWGLVAGALVTLGASVCTPSSLGPTSCDPSPLALLAAPAGAFLGWALGSLVKTEVWSPSTGGR